MTFTVHIEPKAQRRARHANRGKFSVTYKDKGQRLAEDKLIALMFEHRPSKPLQGPLFLQVDAYLPIPKSKPKKWLTEAQEGIVRPTTKPDCSNLVKNIEDVMNGIFYEDDKQIVELVVRKFYSKNPRWVISLENEKGGNVI